MVLYSRHDVLALKRHNCMVQVNPQRRHDPPSIKQGDLTTHVPDLKRSGNVNKPDSSHPYMGNAGMVGIETRTIMAAGSTSNMHVMLMSCFARYGHHYTGFHSTCRFILNQKSRHGAKTLRHVSAIQGMCSRYPYVHFNSFRPTFLFKKAPTKNRSAPP